jgi:large subunit ribosomal protein L25
MTATISAQKRDIFGKKLESLRAQGQMPAVFYGPKEEATPVLLSVKEFKKAWREAGESTVLTLTGIGEDKDVLIHEVSLDPVSGEPRHADFYAIERGKAVQVAVPLEFVGEAPAVKNLGGILVKVMHEMEIEAMPKDLPHQIEIDVSGLSEIDAQIHLSDVKLPAGVTSLADPEEVVALVSAATEEPEEPVEAIDMNTIEVEEKGKKEEEGGEASD